MSDFFRVGKRARNPDVRHTAYAACLRSPHQNA